MRNGIQFILWFRVERRVETAVTMAGRQVSYVLFLLLDWWWPSECGRNVSNAFININMKLLNFIFIYRDFSEVYFSHLQEVLPKLVDKESKLLCRSSDFSVSPKGVSGFSFNKQYTCVKQTAPLIETVVRSIAQNPRFFAKNSKIYGFCLSN